MRHCAVLVLALGLLAGGCDLIEDPSPEQARLVVQGEAGQQVRLIVSRRFVAAVQDDGFTRVVLFEADTLAVTLPYEMAYSIDEDQRFFAETSRLDADLESVQMQVYVDNRLQFDERGILREGMPYRFVYTFNQAITREIIVL